MRECVGDNATAHIRRRQTDFYRSDDKDKSVVLYSLLITKPVHTASQYIRCAVVPSSLGRIKHTQAHCTQYYLWRFGQCCQRATALICLTFAYLMSWWCHCTPLVFRKRASTGNYSEISFFLLIDEALIRYFGGAESTYEKRCKCQVCQILPALVIFLPCRAVTTKYQLKADIQSPQILNHAIFSLLQT